LITEAFTLGPPGPILTNLAGLDMAENSGNNPTLPFVLQRFTVPAVGAPDPKSDYTECNAALAGTGSFLGACPEGARLHLRDDFSSIVPVDGANVIVVGGPRANQVANLANDFLSVIFRGTETATGVTPTTDLYSPGAWDALSSTGSVFSPAESECMAAAPNTNPQTAPVGACTFPIVGNAVVSTYMDVDGTVFLVVYGGNAQDTFWAAQYALQYAATLGFLGGPAFANGESNAASTGMAGNVYCGGLTPATSDYTSNGQVCISGPPGTGAAGLYAGTTSVIFNIDYTNPHPPSITIFKELDTISEVFPEQDA